MNVSVKGEYALLAIFDLASQNSREPVKIADIARRRKIPQKFLELILAGLKQGGFVESRRGAEGGYILAKAAEGITVGEVIRHVEGGKVPRHGAGPQEPLDSLWQRVDTAVSDVVDHTSFADLVRLWRESQGRYIPNWDI